MNEITLVESYEEDGREVNIYEYKGVEISENFFGEGEFSIGTAWYRSLEDATKAIDKSERIKQFTKEEKEFYESYNSRRICSILDNLCPMKEDCKNCELYKVKEAFNKKVKEDKEKYNALFTKKQTERE